MAVATSACLKMEACVAEKLKPCPFCGSRLLITEQEGEGYSVLCRACGATGGFELNKKGAHAAWNMRTIREGDPQESATDSSTKALLSKERFTSLLGPITGVLKPPKSDDS